MEKIEKGNPLTQSVDLVKENLEVLKKLFPTIVKDGNIDIDEIRALLDEEVETNEEYYRFTWAGKSDARREANKPSTATLRPGKDESKNWDTTGHVFIEGDNLEVLKLMQKSYSGKIKMIYIDPPYNTGKDFVYKDNYADNLGNYLAITGQTDVEGKNLSTNNESDGRFHSNWLNMMYPRLKLARALMTDDGVIFISIDDNEVCNLRKLLDELYGEANFVAMITIIVKTEGRRYGYFAKTHEQILVYCKNIENLELNEIEVEGKTFSYIDSHGGFNLKELRNQNTVAFNQSNRPNLRYPFYVDMNSQDSDGLCRVTVDKAENMIEVYPIEIDGLKSVWRWGKDTARENQTISLIARQGSDGVIRIFQKYRKLTETAKTVWQDKKFISNRGTKEVQELLGKSIFDFPKPIGLVKTLMEIGANKEDIILDFFAGSATTAHAVIQMNAEDGGNRKFICVQLPEPIDETSDAYKANYTNIAEIGKERIRRAGEKVVNEKILELKTLKESIDGKMLQEEILQKMSKLQLIIDNIDIGFKVFKLDSSNIYAWDGTLDDFEINLLNAQNNIKENRSEEDILFEILLKYGLDLNVPIEKRDIMACTIYSVGDGVLFICISDNIDIEVAKTIGKWKEELKPLISRALFKDNGFKDDIVKTNSLQILKQYGIEEANSI